MVDLFKCHTSRPIFPATEPLSLGQLRNGGSGYHFQGTFDNKTILIKTILATSFLRIYNRTRQWYETQNQVPTLRTAGDEEPIDLDPEQLSLITQKQRNDATNSRRLAATTHRKSRDADSESFRTGSMWQNGGKWTTLHYHWIRHGWKQLCSFYAENTQVSKDFSKVKITSNSWQSRQERASDMNRSIRICWNFGHRSASTVSTTRKFEVLGAKITRNWTARTTIHLFYRNWTPKILERCFRRSRRAAGEHRRKVNTRFGQEAAPKPKLTLIGFSQRDWKITWARAQHKRDCGFVNISKHFTKILRHGGFHEADGAVRWTPVLTLMEDAEQTPNWNKKDWIDALSRSADNSKYGVWWGPKRNEYLYACSTLPLSRGLKSIQTWSLWNRYRWNWKEHIFHTASSSKYKSIQGNGLSAGRLSLRSTRQAFFFSLLNPHESSSRQRTIEWTGPDDEPRTVLYKKINCPDHDCIY